MWTWLVLGLESLDLDIARENEDPVMARVSPQLSAPRAQMFSSFGPRLPREREAAIPRHNARIRSEQQV